MADHWRLVLSNGVVVDVEVEPDDLPTGMFWSSCVGAMACRQTVAHAVHDAAGGILYTCEVIGLDVHVAEIVAPGRLTQAEETEQLRARIKWLLPTENEWPQ